MRALWFLIMALLPGFAVQAQQRVNNFTVLTNLTVGGSATLTNATANGIALTAHGISTVVNQTAGDLQDLASLGVTDATVASRVRVLRDNDGRILGSGRWYNKNLTDTRTSDGVTIIRPQDVLLESDPGRWVLEGYEP